MDDTRRPAFLDLDADESVTVTQDYFLVRRWGIVREHTLRDWRSFRQGYEVIERAFQSHDDEHTQPH